MEVVTDMIDQVSYECGESSGYIDGSKDGYEYGYHDCILDLVKKRNNYTRTRRKKICKLLYFTKQKLWGVALLLLTFYVGYLSNGDLSAGVITIPIGLILIFSKRRWLL